MMLYKNMKAMVCSPNANTDFFDIVTGVLQGDTLAPYLFMICLDYVLWMSVDLMKENVLTPKKVKRRRYPTETIIHADYANDLALVNTPAQAKSLLDNREQAARDIGLCMNSDKTELMYFKQDRAISTSNGKSLWNKETCPHTLMSPLLKVMSI